MARRVTTGEHPVSMEKWTVHGGRLDHARSAFPDALMPWLDLSTGINPNGWDAAKAGPIDWRALPDPGALTGLEEAAAAHFGVAPSDVCALPGSELGLRLLPMLDLPAPFRHVAPAYATHGEALPDSRAIPADALLDETRQGGTILIANPNNPDGRLLRPEDLLAVAESLAVRGGWLIVDEAFADAAPAASVLPHVAAGANILVLRSFGKFFGLAGVRLGFLTGAPDRLAPLRQRLGSWPLSAAAISIGAAAYRDREWIAATRRGLEERAALLDAMLHRHGFDPIGNCPLFRLLDVDNAPELFFRLAQQGILTRPFDHQPRWLRLGVPGDDEALARLERALTHG
ncbi:threonine-phosphate decarboxylase [Sphingomonas sp. DBB INV C78]|uniref:threonine-phosphate decarboxylase CobD n=1 Tax=Sphingomonas sp. DBB INV C78 TaxID=3349434 RepID=UPI0036D411FC